MRARFRAALRRMPRDEQIGIAVVATAGMGGTVSDFIDLEQMLSRGSPPQISSRKTWKRWVQSWLEEGCLVCTAIRANTNHYRLPLEYWGTVYSEVGVEVVERFGKAMFRMHWYGWNWLGHARLALYLGEFEVLQQCLDRSEEEMPLLFLLGPEPKAEDLKMLPEDYREEYLATLGDYALSLQIAPASVVLNSTCIRVAPQRIALGALRGDIVAAEAEVASLDPMSDSSGNTYAAMALLDLAKNDVASAREHAEQALLRSKGKRKYPQLDGPLSVWSALCALTGSSAQGGLASLLLANPRRQRDLRGATDPMLVSLAKWQCGVFDKPLSRNDESTWGMLNSNLSILVHCIMVRWNIVEDSLTDRRSFVDMLRRHGHCWLHAEVLSLSEPVSKRQSGTLASLLVHQEAWERRLDTLSAFADASTTARSQVPKKTGAQRVVWSIGSNRACLYLSAVLQKRGKKSFSKGRTISAASLWKMRDALTLDEADRKVIHCIEVAPGGYGESLDYGWGVACFAALEGHPRVFWAADQEPAEVVRETPTLRVVRQGKEIVVSPIPWTTEVGPVVRQEGARAIVCEVNPQHVKLCNAIGSSSLSLPAQAESRLSEIMGVLPADISLQTDITPRGRKTREVPPCVTLLVQLRRDSDVLRMTYFAIPLGQGGPQCKPGQGNAVLVAEVDGHAIQTTRDLAEELTQEEALRNGCPSLRHADFSRDTYIVRGLGPTLTLLHELHKMGEAVSCLWKEGEPMLVDMSADMPGLQIRFGDASSWLTADIRVAISDKVNLRAHELVSKLVPGSSKFVQLGDNQFVALSETLSAKIEALQDLGSVGKNGVTMGPANAYALSAWLGDIDGKSAKKGAKLAAKRLAKVRESTSLLTQVPNTFQAQLRSYQLDAYAWLSRLAHWGGGALLCDDMGLGKTVQMLAVLVERATLGPALVVAPVSVGPHWEKLMEQFAPTLRARHLDASGREEAITALGPRDVLVVSYGLLHSECDLLTTRSFTTIVLDEAQAIKNPRSQRARAAFRLQGEFRVVTTGTPIENNLGELWSIMNFANPGLLGTSRQFAENFGKPIQKDGDRQASARLRQMMSPFLLRRTKAQVLTELPAKTEITLEIEPGLKEAEFYAAVCDSMLSEFHAGQNRPAQKRIQILAALMKLRRIACHPSLVDPKVDCGSAKQEAFLDLVDELREAHHRILVFSQFVGHLGIAKANLDAKNISYQYLDGSTSKAKRKKAVDDFQNGEGDVFLISLKAGGVGLHLTGADYVIHLDPWWNPAVEDQASDRAHRIGQTRPVTVYRLVTKGTVEERVLQLHARKRQLAEDLISGNENSGSLGVDELLSLIESS